MKWVVVLSGMLAAATLPAMAAELPPAVPPESVDLATVLTLARGASPRLELERKQIALAQAQRTTAGAYPNPSVSFERARQPGEQSNFGSALAKQWSVQQPILLPGQRSSRVRAADLGVDAARSRLSATANDLTADAGAAYVELLQAQHKRVALEQGMADLDRLRGIVAGRQSAGMASRYDLLRVDIELADWRTQLAEAEADLTDCQGQLAGLLGFPGWHPRGAGELRALQIAEPPPSAGGDSPAVIASRKEEAAALARVTAARRDRLPNFSLSGGQFWTVQPYGKTYSLGFEIEVPLFDTRRGAYQQARAEAESASLQRTLAEAQSNADVERYRAQVQQRSAALAQFEQQLTPRLPQLQQMADDAYRLGRSTVLELLDATRVRYQTSLSRAELTANLMEAQLRLQAALGEFAPVRP
ncbi:TolC family protein [Lysobacter enzymogenes]|uniref:TolC family protein n=1 Tax=Lysobacter enzymogenes TaxID=69 RepID=UPI000894F046|nr:TolC family protein [Lysobacter enzymogenes]SDX76085.1 outer membrane protein, cobalt-zinc-cadmium efflux system [Lysobacter enzymogenes]